MSIKLLQSAEPIIPAVLAQSLEEFNYKLEFGRAVGSVHLDVINEDFVSGFSLPIESWPDKINVRYSEAHLMVSNPISYLEKIKKHGICRAIVHVESTFDQTELLNKARELDLLIGFAVNPDTDLIKVKTLLSANGYIQVMGIHPGRANQEMIEQTPLAVSYLRKTISRQVYISIDGGVTVENVPKLIRAGASYFVTTHALFADGDPKENYQKLLGTTKEI